METNQYTKLIAVDDERDVLMAIEDQLEDDFDVTISTSGQEALEILRSDDGYSVIIADQRMPGMPGDRFLKQAREFSSATRLMLTGYADIESVVRGVNDGKIFGYLNKPWDAAELRVLVHRAREYHRALAELKRERNLLRGVMDNILDGILTIDEAGIICTVNPCAVRLFGYSEAELIGSNVRMLLPEAVAANDDRLRRLILDGEISGFGKGPCEVSGLRKDGGEFPMELNVSEMNVDEDRQFIGVIRDISERKAAEEKIRYQESHDLLTGLPNRLAFQEELDKAMALAAESKLGLAVMVIDLDRFGLVNDEFGHAFGDEVLQEVAGRLKAYLSRTHLVARMGTDQFLVLCLGLEQEADLGKLARGIIAEVDKPIVRGENRAQIGASIGISVFPEDGEDAAALVQNADFAMHRCKETGRGGHEFFAQHMTRAVSQRFQAETEIRRALAERQFVMHYQPKVDIATNRITGVEALMRWNHPERGLLGPGEFIPVAEETGLIREMGQQAIEMGCRQAREWLDGRVGRMPIAVNVSPRQIRSDGFAEQVLAMRDAVNLPSELLELEITEDVVLEDAEQVREVMEVLAKEGIRFSIDDFGTGYSSLRYLQRLPVHALKVDLAFTRNMTTNQSDAGIVHAVVAMAHSLKLKSIAEGIESQDQMMFLRAFQCDEAQGFLFSKALPPEAFETFFAEFNGVDAAQAG